MQRIISLAACRELGGLAAWNRRLTPGRQPAVHRSKAEACVRPFSGRPGAPMCRLAVVLAGQKHRVFSSQPGAEGPPGSSGPRPAVSVVGIPDPITWIRCKVIMSLIELYFELDITSEEFHRGAKQALVHVSNMMSTGEYRELKGIVSKETVKYIEKRCRALSDAQRRRLAVSIDDVIFVLPEDISVVFDQYGRKFCFVVLRFWILSTHDGIDDPEGTKIFKVTSSEDGGPPKKLATAVYEFHRELTTGASPDWTITTVWHWHWKPTE